MATGQQDQSQKPWFLQSSVPVLFPYHTALSLPSGQFNDFLQTDLASRNAEPKEVPQTDADDGTTNTGTTTDGTIAYTPSASTAGVSEMHDALSSVILDDDVQASPERAPAADGQPVLEKHPFVQGLLSADKVDPEDVPDLTNKMFTENGDVAIRSTENPLVDLFSELRETLAGPRLIELLNAAWARDSLATLKIIFNARSIHLGKSSRTVFYRCAGWLAQNHPLTLVMNLRWLSRPVIEKKVAKKPDADADADADAMSDEAAVVVESREADEAHPAHFDVRNGVAHGYWKDLLNILALAADGKLKPLASPCKLLHIDGRKVKNVRSVGKDAAKVKRHETREKRHATAVRLFEKNATYRAVHLAVARLFAEQLQLDLAALHGSDRAAQRQISLCAKWAPSTDRFHDRHTFVVSSIAEILHPASEFGLGPDVSESEDREVYLRHAREAYRKDLSALRAHLDVVERHISAGTFSKIHYERLPSAAMNNYTVLFAKKDEARFDKYLDDVARGSTQISGATLMPSSLVQALLRPEPAKTEKLGEKIAEVVAKVADAQWKTLVQRIRDSGTLPNCIAVCDVSLSMSCPTFPDKTCPMDSAIALSLLVSEVAAPPFDGIFITFSAEPKVVQVDVSLRLAEKVRAMSGAEAGFNTDFVAVFERLILPMAKKNELKQEDMVKRVFVFSDMQFDEASRSKDRWDTSYERIEKGYREAGYEMPELIFWNLAGNDTSGDSGGNDPTAPKPVNSDQPGTAMVSGYSPAMLKVFLDGGSFEDPEVEEDMVDVDVDGNAVDMRERQKMDPSVLVTKAISHKAYTMIQVVD